MLCLFLLYSRVNQLYVYTQPFYFGFPSCFLLCYNPTVLFQTFNINLIYVKHQISIVWLRLNVGNEETGIGGYDVPRKNISLLLARSPKQNQRHREQYYDNSLLNLPREYFLFHVFSNILFNSKICIWFFFLVPVSLPRTYISPFISKICLSYLREHGYDSCLRVFGNFNI